MLILLVLFIEYIVFSCIFWPLYSYRIAKNKGPISIEFDEGDSVTHLPVALGDTKTHLPVALGSRNLLLIRQQQTESPLGIG